MFSTFLDNLIHQSDATSCGHNKRHMITHIGIIVNIVLADFPISVTPMVSYYR
ncbi:MAG: hypothetical protein KAS83_01405 [Dehalococcoidia bacterium]|nr:hypothetical protein [Dehalococcoidia bacterium]